MSTEHMQAQGVRRALLDLQDPEYRDFMAPLIPNVDRRRIIGIRTPRLRALARDFEKSGEAEEFLRALPHFYLEENGLHAFLIERNRDYAACIAALDAFLPFVDNWATCDCLSPVCFRKERALLIGDLRRWLDSEALYTRRFALRMLMNHFLEEDFRPEYPAWAAGLETEEYYLRMMQAWYFATALAKQYDAVLPVFEQRRLDPWTHRKAIQKALESRRITDARKARLRALR